MDVNVGSKMYSLSQTLMELRDENSKWSSSSVNVYINQRRFYQARWVFFLHSHTHTTRSLASFRKAPDLVINLLCRMHFISPNIIVFIFMARNSVPSNRSCQLGYSLAFIISFEIKWVLLVKQMRAKTKTDTTTRKFHAKMINLLYIIVG